MLAEKDRIKIETLQQEFLNTINNIGATTHSEKIELIQKKMDEILSNVSLIERLCIKEIIFDSNKNIYKLLTKPINLAYATQEPLFARNEDFQSKFKKVMEFRQNGYQFLDCFRIKGYFDENDNFICTRIKLCDKYDSPGSEYIKVEFTNGELKKGIVEKKKKGIVSFEELIA